MDLSIQRLNKFINDKKSDEINNEDHSQVKMQQMKKILMLLHDHKNQRMKIKLFYNIILIYIKKHMIKSHLIIKLFRYFV